MPAWTVTATPALDGRTAVVTGANSGLGFRTALQLGRHGANVVLACRDEVRGEDARRRISQQAPQGRYELAELDLADLSSVRRFASEILAVHSTLDILVNNAGVMAIPYAMTADGFEAQIGTNHLGHYALTGLLLPALLARAGSRVVTVSSLAHRTGRIDFADLNSERTYRKWPAYGQSKLANLLFAAELQRRVVAAGRDLLSVAAHPGYSATNLQQRGPALEGSRLRQLGMRLLNGVVAQSDASGALPLLYAATAPDVQGGGYYGPGGPFELRGRPVPVGRSAAARDPDVAARLWSASEALTSVRYDFTAEARRP